MTTSLSTVRAAALAAAVTLGGIAPAAAAPFFSPSALATLSDIVHVVDSAKIIHRDRQETHGVWKKRRHFRERRHDRRQEAHDFDGRAKLYRPKATPKYAYDAYGNYRIYDGDGWDGDWGKRNRWDRDKKRKRPRIVRMNSFGHVEPSPALQDILTAVPD